MSSFSSIPRSSSDLPLTGNAAAAIPDGGVKVATAEAPVERTAIPAAGTDDWSVPAAVKQDRFFVEVGQGTIPTALVELDRRFKEANRHELITHKGRHSYGGHHVEAGEIGLFAHGSEPVIAVESGNYWNWSPTHTWVRAAKTNETINFMGLVGAQVGQSEAMVVQDPNNRVFVIRNGGFVAYGAHGTYRVIDVVDTLNLGEGARAWTDPDSDADNPVSLGQLKEVHSQVNVGGNRRDMVVATFYNVPANNVLIVQQSNNFVELGAGQHVVTNPNTTLRGFFTTCERQKEWTTQPAYTVEGVPVSLSVSMRYQLTRPLVLTAKGYRSPFAALEKPAQATINGLISRLSYQQFLQQRRVGEDKKDLTATTSLDELQQECLDQLRNIAEEFGVVLKSFTIQGRQLEGDIGKELERLSEEVMKNQARSTQVQLENDNNTKAQQGLLEVARVKRQEAETQADAQYYRDVKKAESEAAAARLRAQGEVEAMRITMLQQVENIKSLALAHKQEIEATGAADANIPEGHARWVQLQRIEVEKRKALGDKTVFFTSDGGNNTSASSTGPVQSGFAAALGASMGMRNSGEHSAPADSAGNSGLQPQEK